MNASNKPECRDYGAGSPAVRPYGSCVNAHASRSAAGDPAAVMPLSRAPEHSLASVQPTLETPLSRAPGERVGVPAFSEDRTPETHIHRLLADQTEITLATAESCTGGNVAARLTSVAGSSAYVLGGIVAYANGAKANLLKVSPAVLETVGAVSDECARAMSEGARDAFDATLAVSTTGIAGPGGATARKPVGLVYIAIAGPEGTVSEEHHFPGDRAVVTAAATEAALDLLLQVVRRALATN